MLVTSAARIDVDKIQQEKHQYEESRSSNGSSPLPTERPGKADEDEKDEKWAGRPIGQIHQRRADRDIDTMDQVSQVRPEAKAGCCDGQCRGIENVSKQQGSCDSAGSGGAYIETNGRERNAG